MSLAPSGALGAFPLAARLCLVAAVALVWPASAGAQTLPSSEDCRNCHLTLEDERLSAPAVVYDSDVHAETGFGCLACHGSGGTDDLNPAAGFLAAPTRREIPEMCGRCHSDAAYMREFDPGLRVDQVQEYWTSQHGELLRERNDPAVATCIDCHPAHEIRPPDDLESSVHPANVVSTCGSCHADAAYMAARDVPTDQVADYTSSVHGTLLFEEGDLSAPACNDCHGNHGAAPPGLASVRNVCGQCHSVMADYFDQSAHEEIFEENDLAGCATCHDHHAIQPVEDATLVERSEDVCLECHESPDPSGLEFERMAEALDSLDVAEEESRAVLEEAENVGMEVSQALFDLEALGNVRTQARSAIHTFRAESVQDVVTEGLAITERAEQQGRTALGEYDFRRIGLGLFAGIVVLLVAGLLMRIRDTEERMDALLGRVESFYEQTLASGLEGAATKEQLRLAAAALLLEASYADGRFDDEEHDHLVSLIRNRFGLLAGEAEELIELAEHERGEVGQVGRLAGMIASGLSVERKRVLLDELWSLVYADGELSARELEFMEGLAKLLEMDPAEVSDSRRRAAATTSPDGSPEDT